MSQNAGPSVPSSLTPIRCTTAGTSIVPLEPLARRLEAWLPSPSRWLTHTIRLGYAIQFARRPPKFSGVLETALAARNAPVLREEIAWVSPYQCLHMVPPFEQDVASVAPFSGRLASPSLLPSCNNKQERREASFIEGRNPFRLLGRGTAAWLSPAAMYSVVPAGTKVSEFALG